MTVGGPDAFMPDAPAAETRIPLISDWSPSCCGEAPMKSAVRCVISDGAELDTPEPTENDGGRATNLISDYRLQISDSRSEIENLESET